MFISNHSLVEIMSDGINALKENTEGEGWFQVVMAVGSVLNRLVCGDCTG